jgi:release factor glutamine methyltransferase
MLEDIDIKYSNNVYPPYEDSVLLAKVAVQQCHGNVLEIGCGSGVVSISLAKQKPQTKIVAVDINPNAVKDAKKNAKNNKVKIDFRVSDLFERVREKNFDFILFNPPYLPTTETQKIKSELNFAFDGGKSGLDTIFRFLQDVKKYIKKDGRILIIVSTKQNVSKLDKKIKQLGFEFKIVAQDSFFFEKIYVYDIHVAN